MELTKARELAKDLMAKHGLLEKGWHFKWDKAKTRYGLCSYRRRVISLSKLLTVQEKEENVRDTILHEIAHALVGAKHNHDHVWRAMAVKIGCNPDRCGDTDSHVKYKYVGQCPNGHKFGRHRLTERSRRISCATCCSTFNPKYLVEWEKVY